MPLIPNKLGRKANLPRYHPHLRQRRTLIPDNGGTPSCSHRPLPGEPRDTHRSSFQPVTTPLWDVQTRYFPVQRIL